MWNYDWKHDILSSFYFNHMAEILLILWTNRITTHRRLKKLHFFKRIPIKHYFIERTIQEKPVDFVGVRGLKGEGVV